MRSGVGGGDGDGGGGEAVRSCADKVSNLQPVNTKYHNMTVLS